MIKGRSADSLQYVMEVDNSPSVFALYLLSVFGDFAIVRPSPKSKVVLL